MSFPAGRLLVAALIVSVGAGCAARSKTPAPDVGRAADLVRQGCYDCLLDARAIYESTTGAARAASRLQALEVELLLVLRGKELALDTAADLARARAMAAALGANANTQPTLELVESVAPDPVGTPRIDRPLPALLGARGGLE